MKKTILQQLVPVILLGTILLITISCAGPASEPGTVTTAEDESVTSLAVVDLGNSQSVQFYDIGGGNLAIFGVTNSIELIQELNRMTPVEIYERYTGEKAPAQLVSVQTKSNYNPYEEAFAQAPVQSRYTSAQTEVLFYQIFPHARLVWCLGNQTTTYDEVKFQPADYLCAVAASEYGSFVYEMHRRVIPLFQSAYWQLVFQAIVGPGQYAYAYCNPSPNREVRSRILNSGGTTKFHHMVGFSD